MLVEQRMSGYNRALNALQLGTSWRVALSKKVVLSKRDGSIRRIAQIVSSTVSLDRSSLFPENHSLSTTPRKSLTTGRLPCIEQSRTSFSGPGEWQGPSALCLIDMRSRRGLGAVLLALINHYRCGMCRVLTIQFLFIHIIVISSNLDERAWTDVRQYDRPHLLYQRCDLCR